jgi:hypothetical protein
VDVDLFGDFDVGIGMPCVTDSAFVAGQIGCIGFRRADKARRSSVGHLVRSPSIPLMRLARLTKLIH